MQLTTTIKEVPLENRRQTLYLWFFKIKIKFYQFR